MKVAVRRYSLSLQTELDSKVGGGRLTSAVLTSLLDLGHDVFVVGKAGKLTQPWLKTVGIGYDPEALLGSFDACVVLTGPRNSLYDSLHETYVQLATLSRGARAVYAQWDRALPFAFRPELDKGLAAHGASWKQLQHLQWCLLSQLSESRVRATSGESLGYSQINKRGIDSVYHWRCFFELEEFVPADVLPLHAEPQPAIAYFGSDRPGRLREFRRWFCQPGAPPVHVFGGWSEASKAACAAPNVVFCGPVPEESVRASLNRYRATLYMADPAYVKDDFIAGRFFENAMAAVPTLYSDKLQPSLVAHLPDALALRDPSELYFHFHQLDDADQRANCVALNRSMVDAVAAASTPFRLSHALEEALR